MTARPVWSGVTANARTARAWAADYAYAARKQALHLMRPSLPVGPGGAVPVVLLPGIYETWEFLQPIAERLASRGHPVHAVHALRRNDRPVPEAAEVATAYLDQAGLDDVVLVAHSKGGLVGKSVMLGPAGGRVTGMVAVATPFSGSRLARYTVGRPLRAFDPRHPVLRALAAELSVNERITAVYPEVDPHIPGAERLDGARTIAVPLWGHFRPLGHPLLVELVAREVERWSALPRAGG